MLRVLTRMIVFLLISLYTIHAYAQTFDSLTIEILKNTNSIFTKPEGWSLVKTDSSANYRKLYTTFNSRVSHVFGLYDKKIDIYICFQAQLVRAGFHKLSDSAANNYYLSSKYLSYTDKIPSNEKAPVTATMLHSANVDTVVVFKVPLDTLILGKYGYTKQFVLHKQDVANWELTFFAKNKEAETAINQIFKKTWGVIRFKPDSTYHPTVEKYNLVGKFRHLRPQLKTKQHPTNS